MFGLNLSKYSKHIKTLSIIPLLVALLTFSEFVLPYKNIQTSVVSKKESYRAKFDKTTYNVYFENNNDQFTKEIFDALEVGDQVVLKASYFHEETSEIIKVKTGQAYSNSTGEVYFQYLFAMAFFIAGLSWLKKRSLSSKQAFYISLIIIFSMIDLYRLLK